LGSSWIRPRPLVSKIFKGLLLGLSLRMFRPNLSLQLVSKISNLCDPDPPMLQRDRQTDRHTDGQTTCNLNTALCTIVHRAVKTVDFFSGHGVYYNWRHVLRYGPMGNDTALNEKLPILAAPLRSSPLCSNPPRKFPQTSYAKKLAYRPLQSIGHIFVGDS